MATGKVSPAINARVVPVVSVSATLPAWAAAIAPGQWGVASVAPNSTFNSVDSGLAGSDFEEILQNYNGGAACPPGSTAYPSGALLLWGGGHSLTAFDPSLVALNLSNRQFELVEGAGSGPYNGGGVGTYPLGVYADGYPVPTHTYHYPIFDPSTETFVVPRGASSYTASTRDSRLANCHLYNLAAGAWRVGPNNTTVSTLYAAGGWSVWDDRRSCIWTRPCNSSVSPTRIVKYEGLGSASGGVYGTLTNYTYADSSYNESDAVFMRHPSDADKDLIVYGQYGSTFALRAVPFLSNVPQARATLTVGGFPPVYRKDASLMYSARRGSILYYDNQQPDPTDPGFTFPPNLGRTLVYELIPPADPNNWRTGTWTWNLLSSLTQPVTLPTLASQGITGLYSKARLFAYDDGEIIVACTAWNQPAYAFRVP